jgi:uncharacterized membrane protein YfcA
MGELSLYSAGATILAGYVVFGVTGFGSALVIVPLLTWTLPLDQVVPLVLLLDMPATVMHAAMNLRLVRWPEVRALGFAMAAGAILGALLAQQLPAQWPIVFLGCYVVWAGVSGLRPAKNANEQVSSAAGSTAGLLIGLVELMFGAAGPLVVAWLSRRLNDAHVLRATAPVIIFCSASFALAGRGVMGQLNVDELLHRWVLLMPFVIGGIVIGNRMARRIDESALRRWIASLLVLSGLSLLGQAFL